MTGGVAYGVRRQDIPPRDLRCPACGAVLVVRLLELEDDRDELETLLLLDCPKGHVHASLTHQDIVTAVTAEVLKRLKILDGAHDPPPK